VQGFLLAGHVCSVMGYHEYPPLAQKYGVPMAVTGFEPLDIAQGILTTVKLLESSRLTEVENAYGRVVTYEGNQPAQRLIAQTMEICDRKWRGIGLIPNSGWRLRPEFQMLDAEQRFSVSEIHPEESSLCIAGKILQGLQKPPECPAYGKLCTPEHPLGATMVSGEGACAAYYRYSL
jgi:hydrogenase expression/formation protein HypD